ncbi:hypothetical protein [Brevibacterium casei]|uniref:Uncharacterized protein n=1 Tax=Brevibacterium casei CIP 102111 TaxID=1255625 RepID=A0A2H1IVW2_9MICO|nr:hypothetical protein [Brevibacterium casei]QPR39604.1 hypothetical protein I6G94_01520 [Brevibacterium casei]QPR43768.1 hypothetical protein I6G93_16800 [Brevibacterium casei]SMX79367.1 hypothetical protein BC102111_01646 [Brevibacterium casei CIP 102111]
MIPTLPPSMLDALVQAGGGAGFIAFAIALIVQGRRKGLKERAEEAEKEHKDATAQIAELKNQLEEMEANFNTKIADLKEQFTGQIEKLQRQNVGLLDANYRLRQRLAENGLAHDDIT